VRDQDAKHKKKTILFICGLSNDASSISDCILSNGRINEHCIGMDMEEAMACFKVFSWKD
jgi:hypothetical protein